MLLQGMFMFCQMQLLWLNCEDFGSLAHVGCCTVRNDERELVSTAGRVNEIPLARHKKRKMYEIEIIFELSTEAKLKRRGEWDWNIYRKYISQHNTWNVARSTQIFFSLSTHIVECRVSVSFDQLRRVVVFWIFEGSSRIFVSNVNIFLEFFFHYFWRESTYTENIL